MWCVASLSFQCFKRLLTDLFDKIIAYNSITVIRNNKKNPPIEGHECAITLVVPSRTFKCVYHNRTSRMAEALQTACVQQANN